MDSGQPPFFSFRPSTDVDHGAPWSMTITARKVVDDYPCDNCRAENLLPWHFEGPAIAEGISGKDWGDIIGSGGGPMAGPTFMVSERVIETLKDARVTGFAAYPVTLRAIKSAKLRRSVPRYFHLHIERGIWIDFTAYTGTPDVCSKCGQMLGYVDVKQRIPRPETWNGKDVFEGWNAVGPFCSKRVLLLAREQRWTNFLFNPVDVDDRLERRWRGIDYLGKKWPPQWYPNRPSHGKTLEQWLGDYFTKAKGRKGDSLVWNAERALEDIGAPALPPLIERLNQGSQRAAHGIHALALQGVKMPDELLERVEQICFEAEAEWNPHLFERDASGRLRRKEIRAT